MITIAQAQANEAQAVRNLENRVWNEDVVNKYDIPMMIRFGWCFVAKDKGHIVGAILSYPTKSGEVYICDWVVLKKYQGQHIGIKLYERLIRELNGTAIVTFVDPTNTPSLRAHKKLGFRVVRRIKNPYNLNEGFRILFRRTLNNKP